MEDEIDFGAAIMKPGGKGKLKPLTPESTLPAVRLYDLEPVKNEIQIYSSEINKMVEQVKAIEVTDDGSNRAAVEIGNKAKGLWKQLEAVRKREIDEPNEFVHGVNRFTKMFQDPLKEVEKEAKKKVNDYQYRLELKRREEERIAQEEHDKYQAQLDKEAKEKKVKSVKVVEVVLPKAEKVTRTETGSSHQRLHWTFELINLEELVKAVAKGEVDINTLMLNEKTIQQMVGMAVRNIPGIRIFEKSSTVFRP